MRRVWKMEKKTQKYFPSSAFFFLLNLFDAGFQILSTGPVLKIGSDVLNGSDTRTPSIRKSIMNHPSRATSSIDRLSLVDQFIDLFPEQELNYYII